MRSGFDGLRREPAGKEYQMRGQSGSATSAADGGEVGGLGMPEPITPDIFWDQYLLPNLEDFRSERKKRHTAPRI